MFIKEVILQTNLPDALKKFYKDLLEIEVINSDEKSFSLRLGMTRITFVSSVLSNIPFYHFAFNIPENQFHEAKSWAKERVRLIDLNGEDEFNFESWNAHSFYFYDPAGNILELIARHNLVNKSLETFTGRSLLNVSEIGIPVHNVNEFFESVNSGFGIPLFSGDLKTFVAAGDDNGLMIIVPEGRKWFPDCAGAGIFPMTITLKGYDEKELRFEKYPYCIRETSD